MDPILWLFDQKHRRYNVRQISQKRESQQTECPVRCRPRRNLQTILKLQYQVPMAVFWPLNALDPSDHGATPTGIGAFVTLSMGRQRILSLRFDKSPTVSTSSQRVR